MRNNFQFVALQDEKFKNLFSMDEEELKNNGAIKMIVDEKPGFPCRVSLEDAEIGEEVILVHYEHHNVKSPYKSSGPIFIRNEVKTRLTEINEIPEMFIHRFLSLRCYNNLSIMIDARAVEGIDVSNTIDEIFDNKEVEYIHIHNARPGCYNCLVKRA